MKSSSGYEIYHNTLSGCLNEIENYVTSKGYTIGDYFPLINHIPYGATERTQLEMLKDDKVANTLAIQIYRMESGKYELNCYPVRKFALGGGIESNTEKLILEIKKNSFVTKGIETNAKDGSGQKYRYDHYKYKANSAPNWIVLLFDKCAKENGKPFATQFNYKGIYSIHYDRNPLKNQPNGKIGMSELVLINFSDKFALGGGVESESIYKEVFDYVIGGDRPSSLTNLKKQVDAKAKDLNLSVRQIYQGMEEDRASSNDYHYFSKGGYTRPSYKIITTGFFSFKTKNKEYIVRSSLFERQNDTEDLLEIQDELRGEIGGIIIQNSAWKRLSDGKTIKARSSKGNLMGTLTRVASLNENFKPNKFAKGGNLANYKVGDKFKYNYDNKTYQVLEITDKKITLSPDLSSYWNNREVSIYLMNKWIKDKMMIKTMATGGGTQTYKDLSKETPMVVNDSATKVGKVPEIDIIKTGNTFDAPAINNSEKSVQIFMKFWNENNIEIVEQMNVMFLNKANKPIGIYQHSKGGIDGTILDIEIISAMAVKSLAKAVIIAHNHPSGNTRPSDADKKMTRQLSNALELFHISLLDSLIITKENYFSFADEGLMN